MKKKKRIIPKNAKAGSPKKLLILFSSGSMNHEKLTAMREIFKANVSLMKNAEIVIIANATHDHAQMFSLGNGAHQAQLPPHILEQIKTESWKK